MLIVTICAPYLFTFFDSIFKALFGNKPWPTLRILLLVLIVETAHSFGISIFVFRVLPKLDVARAILMMNAVCTVPGIFKFFLSKTHVSTAKRLIIFIMDFCAVLMQCSVFGIVFASKFMFKSMAKQPQTQMPSNNIDSVIDAGNPEMDSQTPANDAFDYPTNERLKRDLISFIINQTTTVANTLLFKRSIHRRSDDYDELFDNTNSDATKDFPRGGDSFGVGSKTNGTLLGNFNIEDILSSFQIEWELPIALMLVSLVWWENFVDRDIKCGSFKLVNMKLLKENIIATRCKTSFISSLWKIMVTLLFAYIFHPGIFNTSKVFSTPEEPDRFNYGAAGGDFGVWGLSPNNFMNQVPNGAFGPMNIPPPPPMPISKRSVSDLTNSSDNYNFTTIIMPTTNIISDVKINLSNIFGYAMNNKELNRQFMQAFTAPQMFIPSMSTRAGLDFGNGELPPPPSKGEERDITFRDHWITYLLPMILQVICSGLCYYTGRLACKLCMQRLGFALPLTLVTPITLSIALIICKWFPDSSTFQTDFVYWTCHEGYETGSFKWQVICGLGLWWLSQLWIGGHVWFGKGQRLAFTER